MHHERDSNRSCTSSFGPELVTEAGCVCSKLANSGCFRVGGGPSVVEAGLDVIVHWCRDLAQDCAHRVCPLHWNSFPQKFSVVLWADVPRNAELGLPALVDGLGRDGSSF